MPKPAAESRTRLNIFGLERFAGLLRTATRSARGRASCNSSTYLSTRSSFWFDRPVVLPPGRARLVTSPLPSGSLVDTNTIGTVFVACCAARTDAIVTTIITVGSCFSSSSMRAGNRS